MQAKWNVTYEITWKDATGDTQNEVTNKALIWKFKVALLEHDKDVSEVKVTRVDRFGREIIYAGQ